MKYQIILEVANTNLYDIVTYIKDVVEEYPCVSDEYVKILAVTEIKDA